MHETCGRLRETLRLSLRNHDDAGVLRLLTFGLHLPWADFFGCITVIMINVCSPYVVRVVVHAGLSAIRGSSGSKQHLIPEH